MCDINSVITAVSQVLSSGGTILYPTDTIWGLGCDATNAAAVEKIYSLKQRDHSKSMLILCADLAMVKRFVGGEDQIPQARLLAYREELLCESRPTTVIMPLQASLLADNLVAADGTIGVRIPRMDFCQRMLRSFGFPVVSTSANFSGQPSPDNYGMIDECIKKAVDYVVPACYEMQSLGVASRIVKVDAEGSLTVLRS